MGVLIDTDRAGGPIRRGTHTVYASVFRGKPQLFPGAALTALPVFLYSEYPTDG